MDIGNAIYRARKLRGLKQYELADMVNVSKSTISQIENGTRNAKEKVLSDICISLGVTKEYLLLLAIDKHDFPISDWGSWLKVESYIKARILNLL
ncbi:MAG TPA: helix-turn-helix transcriptional regulator [Saprospiraceae bacterium]|jgi:transcriptional regulator with XRE-family HTH domain|nr:helix-turn-helix transcriptional regulator [Saprospiraceae bacterium]HQW96532.1 helix-turn-helix transcriptional regulator [Saprospiraceae bacterium]